MRGQKSASILARDGVATSATGPLDGPATRCAFLGTSVWFPSDAQCRRECVGLRMVRPAYQAAQHAAAIANEPIPNGIEFLRARFDLESSPLTARVAWHGVIRDYEDALGL